MNYRSTLIDRLMAHDPALSRVRMGARVTLTILVSILILIGVHRFIEPLPAISYALAIVLSIEGGVAVRDNSSREQLKTRVLGCAVSLACITFAAVLEDYRLLADLAFLVVILGASLARIYGKRGFAVGMFAFISYFIGAYLRPSLGELHLAALGPVVAISLGHLTRTYLLPDDWRRDLIEALRAMQARVSDVMVRLAVLSSSATVTNEDREELGQLEEQLKDVALMAEGLLPRNADEKVHSDSDPVTALSLAIFDLHLAAESAIIRATEAPAPFLLVDALIEGDHDLAEKIAAGPAVMEGGENVRQSVHALLWMKRSLDLLADLTEKGAARGFRDLVDLSSETPGEKPDFSWRNPIVRAAVQITIASAIAMIAGLSLSRERWFWAVLTAFLVFNNTKSRGDAAIRAMQRSVGTLLGVAIGLGIATWLSGQVAAAVVLATICVFLAFYFLQVSYAVMSFFVTIVLCLVYGLIGQLTMDVLLLRLEETVIGAAAGIFVAFLVFPASTHSNVDLALARWYDSLEQLLEAVRAGEGRYRLIDLSNRLDAGYRELTIAARPLGSAWSLVTRPGPVRQTLSVFLAASYWGRHLAHDAARAEKPLDGGAMSALTEAMEAVNRAKRRGAGCFSSKKQGAGSGKAAMPALREGAANGADMIANLINRLYPV